MIGKAVHMRAQIRQGRQFNPQQRALLLSPANPIFSLAILYIRYRRFLPAETVIEAKELVEGEFEYVCYCDATVT